MSAATYMITSGLCFALVHASVKYLPGIPTHQLVFLRALISLSISYAMLRHAGISPWGRNKRTLFFRGLAGTVALLLYFYTIQNMPLASAVTIQYLHPIFTVILAGLFLRERPSWVQWTFFAASFAGVLMVQGFDTRVSPTLIAIGVFSAFCSACAYNMIRVLRHEDHALVVVFYLPLVSVFVIGPFITVHWVQPVGFQWLVILFIGVFTQIAQYCMTKAYQADSAANISNLNYLGIIYALAIGVFVFAEPVHAMSLIGMAVISASAILSTRFRKAS